MRFDQLYPSSSFSADISAFIISPSVLRFITLFKFLHEMANNSSLARGHVDMMSARDFDSPSPCSFSLATKFYNEIYPLPLH